MYQQALFAIGQMRLEWCHTEELDRWIGQRHYLGDPPCGARLRLWVLNEQGERIGAMMWARPTARRPFDGDRILELTRMYIIDDIPPFVESKALGMARKVIRKHFPEIKGLIAYSSEDQGHKGIIYQADGWFVVSNTAGGASWNNNQRTGRADKDTGRKILWVRSP